jgi:hypothetical protein
MSQAAYPVKAPVVVVRMIYASIRIVGGEP